MTLKRNKLYSILFIACFAGYIWVYFNVSKTINENFSVEVCLFKRATNIPCPSCGATRSVISLIEGNFLEAFKINPIGIVVAIIMIIAPFWIIIDVITKNNSLFNFYQKIEFVFKKTKYIILLILLVTVNWIWNITKGL